MPSCTGRAIEFLWLTLVPGAIDEAQDPPVVEGLLATTVPSEANGRIKKDCPFRENICEKGTVEETAAADTGVVDKGTPVLDEFDPPAVPEPPLALVRRVLLREYK